MTEECVGLASRFQGLLESHQKDMDSEISDMKTKVTLEGKASSLMRIAEHLSSIEQLETAIGTVKDYGICVEDLTPIRRIAENIRVDAGRKMRMIG